MIRAPIPSAMLLLMACFGTSTLARDTTSPQAVVEALIAAAKAEDVTALGTLCSIDVERGVEIGNICALGGVGVFVESTNGVIRPQPRSDTQALTAKYRSSFVKIFQTGTIEKVSTSDTNQARVTCRFLLPDGKQKRLDIVVEQHQASWYLSRFDPPGDAVDPKPKRADTRP